MLGDVFWEHVLRLVNVVAELNVVDFFEVALIVVFSADKLSDFGVCREEIELLEDS